MCVIAVFFLLLVFLLCLFFCVCGSLMVGVCCVVDCCVVVYRVPLLCVDCRRFEMCCRLLCVAGMGGALCIVCCGCGCGVFVAACYTLVEFVVV